MISKRTGFSRRTAPVAIEAKQTGVLTTEKRHELAAELLRTIGPEVVAGWIQRSPDRDVILRLATESRSTLATGSN